MLGEPTQFSEGKPKVVLRYKIQLKKILTKFLQ